MRTYLCLPGAWMGAWSGQCVLERRRAAGQAARARPLRGGGERAAELSPELDTDVFLADTIATLENEDLKEVVLVGHSFGSLIAGLVTDRIPERIAHLVIIDGGIPQDAQSTFGPIPADIDANRRNLLNRVTTTTPLPPTPPPTLTTTAPP